MAYLNDDNLKKIGFKKIGSNVKISDKVSIYGAEKISIGDNSRVDDFCILSAGEEGIEIGSYVHIAAFCSLIGKGKITMKDFSGLSARVSVYSSSDDYSGEFMTNPCVPPEYTNVKHGIVTIGKHVIIGANSVILPEVVIADGSAVGAFSLVIKDVPQSCIVSGIPAKYIKARKIDLFNYEEKLIKRNNA